MTQTQYFMIIHRHRLTVRQRARRWWAKVGTALADRAERLISWEPKAYRADFGRV